MKKLNVISLIVFLFLLNSACTNLAESDEALIVPQHRDASYYQDSLTSTAQEYLSLLENATVYDAEIEIDPSYRVLHGDLRVYFINNQETPLSEIYFRLFPNYNGGEYEIRDVQAAGEGASWGFESEKTALRVALPQPLSPGDEQDILISFSLSIPEEMGGNYDIFGYHDQILALDNLLPVIPVYDQDGWQIDYPAKSGDLPYVDPGFYHLIITAPEELVIAASGTETVIANDPETAKQTVEIFAGPIRDFYLSASPLYTLETIVDGGIMINSYALPGLETHQVLALEIGEKAISLLSEHIGDYPYSEFDIVASPVGSAMEYPGIVAIGLDKYDEKGMVAGQPAAVIMVTAVVHETAHQWFYNMLGTDQVNSPWLDESFAVYLTHLYYQEIEGGAWGYENAMSKSWNRAQRAEIPIGMQTAFYKKHEYSPIVYARGMMFLLALKDYMGEDVFAATLKDYFQSYIWMEIGPDDFRHTAETNCGCDLSDLWEKWVYPETDG
jgi:hypothetical protein